MKTSKRFDNAITALVNGFMNETLAKGNCVACAVGNMVANSIGFKLKKEHMGGFTFFNYPPNAYWSRVFSSIGNRQRISNYYYKDEAKENIDATGYNVRDLAYIEHTFESNTNIDYSDYPTTSWDEIIEDQYKGLMAVVDVLCEIEGIESTEFKKLFKKPEPKKIEVLDNIIGVTVEHPNISSFSIRARFRESLLATYITNV